MKKTNKGFSLVELIIVIAIMAILAGAIAPALIKYIDKSRKSNDVSSAKTIKTAVETALGNENIYELCTSGTATGSRNASAIIVVVPGKSTASGTGYADAVKVYPGASATAGSGTEEVAKYTDLAQKTIAQNIGETTPKIKYKKNAKEPKTGSKPSAFVATCTAGGSVEVWVAATAPESAEWTVTDGEAFQLCPEIDENYQ